jgi:hypothetical protein
MENRQPVATFYLKEESAHFTFLEAAKTKTSYAIEVAQTLSKDELNELHVAMWPKDLKVPPYQFKYSDKAKHVLNPGRADFNMPIDNRKDAPAYVVAIYADGNKVDLSRLQFSITGI